MPYDPAPTSSISPAAASAPCVAWEYGSIIWRKPTCLHPHNHPPDGVVRHPLSRRRAGALDHQHNPV